MAPRRATLGVENGTRRGMCLDLPNLKQSSVVSLTRLAIHCDLELGEMLGLETQISGTRIKTYVKP